MSHPSVGFRRLIGIWGNSGTGKTVTLRTLSREWKRRFHYDRSSELIPGIDVAKAVRTREEVLDYVSGLKPEEECSIAYQPIVPAFEDDREALAFEAAECGFLARIAMAARRCLFTVDEGARCCRHNFVHASTVAVALEGRKLFVSAIFASQRPFHVAPDIRSEAYGSEVFVYRLKHEDDRDDIKQAWGRELSEHVRRLPNLNGLYLHADSEGRELIERVRLTPHDTSPSMELSPFTELDE